MRPIKIKTTIVFSEISHVKRNREGVFISERSPEALSNKIKFILLVNTKKYD